MTHRQSSRFFAALLVGLSAACASAEVTYRVTPHTDTQTLSVEMTFPRLKFDTDVQMPNWAPGAYILANFSNGIKNLHAYQSDGSEIPISKPNEYTWRLSTATGDKLRVTYDVSAAYSDKTMHYSGPATYMYLVDRKTEACKLNLDVPAGWKVAIGLVPDQNAGHTFKAKTYDVLADNPVTMGDFQEVHYTAAGRDATIAMRGEAKGDVDVAHLVKAASFVDNMEADFFGGAPYDKYVWHFGVNDRPDGAGGLEHLSSTQIGLSSGVGPRAVTVLSHEHFHLWNVKRIRSSVLGPFDYTQLPQTGALWWLEGVTDYYSHFLLHRYGWWADKDLYEDVVKQVDGVRSNPKRLEISPYDSSYRVKESNNGKGNSNGLYVSYYNTGWLLGMCLDIEIRSQTGGQRSLDDVELALWKQCRNDQPGFPEDGIRTQCVKFGGPSLGSFYDKYVMQPGELPVEAQLTKVGLTMADKQITDPTLGFTFQCGRSIGGAQVGSVTDKDSLAKAGDVITDIDGKPLGNRSAAQIQQIMDAAVKNSKPGTPIHVKITRKVPGADPQMLEADLNPSIATRTIHVIAEDPAATATQIKLREGWFWGSHKRPSTIVGP